MPFLTHACDAQDPTKTLNVTGCTFLGNSVNLEDEDLIGGAIAARGGAVNVIGTLFQENNGRLSAVPMQFVFAKSVRTRTSTENTSSAQPRSTF